MAKKYFSDAMRDALREEMKRDERIIILGEDVKVSPYGYTRGLFEEFPGRVLNTPIAEQTTIGVTLGAAMCGLRPFTDLMMGNFFYTGWDQLANQVAKLRYMTGGQFSVPAVFASTIGVGGNVGAQHSDVPYAQMVNLGGIKVVVPSSPYDAKGLLKSAIREDNPVIFLAPTGLIGVKDEVPDEEYLIPLGRSEVKQEGKHVSIIAVGAMVKKAFNASKKLAKEGISVEIVDPRTLHPMDYESILQSVAKTGRLVVVDEAREACGIASQVAAHIAEYGYRHLKAPIVRVASKNVPVPFSPPMEDFVVPGVDQIVQAVHKVIR